MAAHATLPKVDLVAARSFVAKPLAAKGTVRAPGKKCTFRGAKKRIANAIRLVENGKKDVALKVDEKTVDYYTKLGEKGRREEGR